MTDTLPELKAEVVRLNKVIDALMNRVESASSLQGSDFNLFETAVTLEEQVIARTAEIEQALQETERIRTELAASEAKYRALVNQSFVGIAIIEDGKFTFTNRRFEEILGYSSEELCRLSPNEVTVAEDRPLVAEQMRKRLAGESDSVHYQARIQRKDGSLRFIEIDGTMAEIGGKVVPISAVKDITDQVRKEQELQASESQFRAIFENSLGGIVITRIADGRINEVNDAFLSISGYSRNELLGQSTLELGIWRNPEQRTAVLQRVQQNQPVYAEPATLRTRSGAEKELLVSARSIYLRETPCLIVSTTDVSEFNQAKIEIDNQRLRLQALIEAQPSGIALFNADRRLVLWNARYYELLHYPEEMLVQTNLRFDDLIRHNHARGDYPDMTEAETLTRLVGHVSTHTPLHMVRKGYGGKTLEIDIIPLSSGDTLLSYNDITEISTSEEQMRTLANHDPLTRLPNRRLFTDRIVLTIAANKRSHKYAAVMMLDLDRFKSLNDLHGHQAGDALLVEVGARLKHSVRDEDTVARVGGDEFVVMLVNLNTDPEKAAIEASFVADKILTSIATPYFIEMPGKAATKTIEHQCSCSIGIAVFGNEKEDVEQIIKNADSAMYQAKAEGRNRACLFGENTTSSAKASR